MLAYTKRGPQRLGNAGVGPLRADQTGALVVSHAHARFQEAVLNGNVWIGSNPFGTPVTPGVTPLLNVAAPLTLYNPINSPVNLVLWEYQFIPTTTQAAHLYVVLAYNVPALTGVSTAPASVTNGNITNALLGLGQAQSATVVQNAALAWGQIYRIATLAEAPVVFRYPFTWQYKAADASETVIAAGTAIDHIDGAVVIPPGVAVSASFSQRTPGVSAFVWEEVLISN